MHTLFTMVNHLYYQCAISCTRNMDSKNKLVQLMYVKSMIYFFLLALCLQTSEIKIFHDMSVVFK
jgi:hypothetical protein